jgi:hypothetical protein
VRDVGPSHLIVVSATATNLAGNQRSVAATYTVGQAWTLSGFYTPVDMGGVWNTLRNGATVPLKFEVFDARLN